MQIEEKKESRGEAHPETGPMVTIQVGGQNYSIHRGHQTIVAIKSAAGIPLDYELDMVVDGRFEPLPDDGAVTLKGGEEFFAHPKRGGSS